MKNITEYKIPEANWQLLNSRIDKLNQKAAKLGCEKISLTIVRTEDELVDQFANDGQVVRFFYVTFTGSTPKLAGWTFLAVINHLTEGNIVRTAPDTVLPEQYRSTDNVCDHCQTKRNRLETYVVQHDDDGTTKQVGSNCIKDFLGHANPEKYLGYAEILFSANDLLGLAQEEGFGGSGGFKNRVNLETYLAQTATFVRLHGFMSRGKANEHGGMATADDVLTFLVKRSTEEERKTYAVTDDDKKLATEVLAWANALTEADLSNDYLYNVSIVAKQSAIEFKFVGIAASMISAYQRAMAYAFQRKENIKSFENSQFVGTVGKREVFTLTLFTVIRLESMWGVSNMHKFQDDAGNVLVWFSSTMALENGKYRIKGTVKKHETYTNKNPKFSGKPINQTMLSRCVVVETIKA